MYILDVPEDLAGMPERIRNMHDPDRVILFRHFTDALVRVGYLKNYRKIDGLAPYLEDLFAKIKKIMFQDINTTTSTSKNRLKYADLMSNIYLNMRLMKSVFEKFNKELLALFTRYLVKP